MTDKIPDADKVRSNPARWEILDELRGRLERHRWAADGGPMVGQQVVRWTDVETTLQDPLPPPTLHTAEVVSPAAILVQAICPKCDQGVPMLFGLSTVLKVDSSGGELSIKGKSKARTHDCNQTVLDDATATQTSIDDFLATDDGEDDDDAADDPT